MNTGPRLRYPPTSRRTRLAAIGPWPTGATGTSANHAREHWNRAAQATAATPVEPGAERVLLLAFVGNLAAQVTRCPRCWRDSPLDPIQPNRWAWWALAQRPALRQVVEALVPNGRKTMKAIHRAHIRQRRLPVRDRITRG